MIFLAHMRMTGERGIGEIDDIEIYIEDINKIRGKFKHPFSNLKGINILEWILQQS